MPLTPPPDSWTDAILRAASRTFNGVITVRTPGTPGTFNPTTDVTTGGTAGAVLIQSRAARIQVLGVPREVNGQYGWDSEDHVRFQCEIFPGDPALPKGSVVTIENGGDDPSLTGVTSTVIKALNSSHAALRTIEAVTEG
jgi:hypothetical protein